ncbi:hypothetical protein M9458_010635, partial [Cirrhinus mrigala]
WVQWPNGTHCIADHRQEFQLALSNRFAQLADSDDVDEEEQKIAEAIINSPCPLCPPIQCRTQPWISEECLDLVAAWKKAKRVDFERYRQLNRDIRKMMKRDREAYWDQVAHDLEEAASRHEYRTLYRTLRGLSGKSKSTNDNIKKADGTFVCSTAERLQRWKEFFDGLYNHDPPQGPPAAPPVIDLPPAPMSDARCRTDPRRGQARCVRLEKWEESRPVATPSSLDSTTSSSRSGDSTKSQQDGRRPSSSRFIRKATAASAITIAESAFFQSSANIANRLAEKNKLDSDQGVDVAIRSSPSGNWLSGISDVDSEQTLEADHVPPKIISLLKSANLSDEFEIKTGIRQGDVASLLLFNIVIDAIMRRAFDGRRGVQFADDQFVTDLMFADDSAIFAQDDAEATDILYDIACHARPYGLKISAEKTKVMTTDGSPATVYLEDVQLEQVQKFKEENCSDGGHSLKNRTSDGCFRLPLMVRLEEIQCHPFHEDPPPGSFSSMTSTNLRYFKCDACDKSSNNDEIRHRCHNQPSIDEQIQRRQLRWFGHVCRMSDHRLPHRLLWRQCPDHWRIRRDAPKNIWVKQIEHDLKPCRLNLEQAKTVATDRQAWKKIVGEIGTPAAPTAAYWLRRRPPLPTAS